MKVNRQDLPKSQIELTVEVDQVEVKPFIDLAVEALSREIKIEGFRPGKVPFEILKQKIGEMSIMEEAARLFINRHIFSLISEHIKDKQVVGQPEISLNKLAPGNPLEYKMKVTVLPEINLGQYRDFAFKKEKIEASEKDLEKVLNDLVEMRTAEKISADPIKAGHKVVASVNMFLNQVPTENGQNPEVNLLIGHNHLVEGFDDNLIGLKKGDKKEFSLPYPADHWQKNLAGKLVEFKVEIKEVYDRLRPEINDDLAKVFRFNNLTELRDNLKKTITEQKQREKDQALEVKILDQIIAGTKFGELAEDLIKNESELMLREIEQGVVSQGGRLEDYLKSINRSADQLMLDLMPKAVQRVKSALVLREISRTEKIDLEAGEVQAEIDRLKKQYQNQAEAIKNISSPAYKVYLENYLLNQKTISRLKEWNLV